MADGPILLQKDNTYTKLFVGGLPYSTTNETLKKYFLEFGDIEEAVVIHDKVTQKSKGYGFVSCTPCIMCSTAVATFRLCYNSIQCSYIV